MLKLGFEDQSHSSIWGQPTNDGLVLKSFLSETICAKENGSRGTHFAKFLISNFLKGLTCSALWEGWGKGKGPNFQERLGRTKILGSGCLGGEG